jgi:hypothetical protein
MSRAFCAVGLTGGVVPELKRFCVVGALMFCAVELTIGVAAKLESFCVVERWCGLLFRAVGASCGSVFCAVELTSEVIAKLKSFRVVGTA